MPAKWQNLDHSIENRPGVNIQWIFRWIMIVLRRWILSMLLNFDTFMSHNLTDRRYVNRSEFHFEIWRRSQFNVELWPESILDTGHYSNVESWPSSKFNMDSWAGFTIQQGETGPRSQVNVESWPVGQISSCNLGLELKIQWGSVTCLSCQVVDTPVVSNCKKIFRQEWGAME